MVAFSVPAAQKTMNGSHTIPNMKFKFVTLKNYAGFTLIELMVTVAIAAILAALAAPSLGEFSVRNKLTSIGNDFSGSVLRARNEAIGKNTCVTMCMSSTIDNDQPVCATSGQDWQIGWIVFLNPACDSSLTEPKKISDGSYSDEDLILIRRPVGGEYYLKAQDSRRTLFFNSRGNSRLSDADNFRFLYRTISDPLSIKYGFNICLDAVGRTRTIPAGTAC